MKVFVDRTSDLLSVEDLKSKGRALRGKVAYLASTSINETADDSFLNSFINTFEYLGIKYGANIHINCHEGFDDKSCETEIFDFVKVIDRNS